MTSDETKTLIPGTLILLTYGNGTQGARVVRVTRTGSVEVDRLRLSKDPAGDCWTRAKSSAVKPRDIIGLLGLGEKHHRAMAILTKPVVML